MNAAALSDADGAIRLLELASEDLVERTGLDLVVPEQSRAFESFVSFLTKTLTPTTTGVVISPQKYFSVIQALAPNTGVAFALERPGPVDPLALPPLWEQWGVEQTKQNSAVAKLALYYHPLEEMAVKKQQFLAEIYRYCHHEGIDLLLELGVYSLDAKNEDPQNLLLRSIKDLRNLCDVIALPAVGDSITGVTITAELDIPWIAYAPPNTSFDDFKKQLAQSVECGAAGFVAGEVLWSDVLTAEVLQDFPKNEAEASKLIKGSVADRLGQLQSVAST